MLQHELGRKWREISWNAVLNQEQSADKYFMRSGLIRKDLLPLYCGLHMPETYVVASMIDIEEIINKKNAHEENSRSDSMWVLKLCDSSNAYGMHIISDKNLDTIRDVFTDGQKRVLQKYVNPMLIHGRKFHIRVLVLAVGHLSVYVFEEYRVLLASEPFTFDTLDPLVHITNQSMNKSVNYSYEESSQNLSMKNAFSEDVEHDVIQQIHKICRETFQSLAEAKNRRHFFSLPNCYELFGFDFMVDATGRVVLLEVNPDPSLSMFHGREILPSNVLETEIPCSFTEVYSLQKHKAFLQLKNRYGCK